MTDRDRERDKERGAAGGQRVALIVAVAQRIPRVSIMYWREDKVQNCLFLFLFCRVSATANKHPDPWKLFTVAVDLLIFYISLQQIQTSHEHKNYSCICCVFSHHLNIIFCLLTQLNDQKPFPITLQTAVCIQFITASTTGLFHNTAFWLVPLSKAQVFYLNVPVSPDSLTVSEHQQYQNLETEAARLNLTIINFLIYKCEYFFPINTSSIKRQKAVICHVLYICIQDSVFSLWQPKYSHNMCETASGFLLYMTR